jgi:rhodanese-related sulfurtransferase
MAGSGTQCSNRDMRLSQLQVRVGSTVASESGVLQDLSKSAVDNLSVDEAWRRLGSDPKAQLVDVRTKAEWRFVGVPDLAPIGRSALQIEWQTYPEGAAVPDFVDRCAAALRQSGAGPDQDVFFLCRSGARSLSAARAMANAGFPKCHNVAEGFEGPLDRERHRAAGGWKVAGLPWYQG